MRVFRYVSWAGNGVSHPLMENLSSEIAIDFGLIQEEFDELATRADLTAAEKAELAALQTKIKDYERTTRDVLEVGRTDAAMATMMLGQTDDKYVGVEEDIRKIFAVIAADSTSIVRNLVTATKTEALSLAIGLIICLVFSVAAIAFIARSIIKPITLITGVMQKLSAGDTAVTLRYRERTDEIGRMIEAIEIFRSNALEIQKIQQLRRQAEEQQASERRTEMAALAEEFDSSVKHITSQLAGAVTAVRDNAEAMTKVAEDTRTKSGTAVEAVAHTQENVETVARAASELSLTIDELSRRTNDVFQADPEHRRAVGERECGTGEARRFGRADFADYRSHPRVGAADQSPRVERDDRGRARRDSGQGLRGSGVRGQNPRPGQRQGDRRYRAEDRGCSRNLYLRSCDHQSNHRGNQRSQHPRHRDIVGDQAAVQRDCRNICQRGIRGQQFALSGGKYGRAERLC